MICPNVSITKKTVKCKTCGKKINLSKEKYIHLHGKYFCWSKDNECLETYRINNLVRNELDKLNNDMKNYKPYYAGFTCFIDDLTGGVL